MDEKAKKDWSELVAWAKKWNLVEDLEATMRVQIEVTPPTFVYQALFSGEKGRQMMWLATGEVIAAWGPMELCAGRA